MEFGKAQMTDRTELCGADLDAKSSLEAPEAVKPVSVPVSQGDGVQFTLDLKPASWNVLRFKVSGK